MKVILLLLCTFLATVYSQCAYSNSFTSSLSPTSDTILVNSLESIYDNFNVKWDTSFTDQIQVQVDICSSDAGEFNAFTYTFLNTDGGAQLLLLKNTDSGAPGNGNNSTLNTTSSGGTTTSLGVDPHSAGSNLTPSSLPLLCAIACFFAFPNKRLSVAFLLLAAVLLMGSPSIARAASSNTSINITIYLPTTMNNLCISGSCYNRTATGDIGTGYISLFGKRFSGMGGMSLKCNGSIPIALDAGWTFAPATQEAKLAIYIYGYSWNSWLIVTSDGVPYEAGYYGITDGGAAYYTLPDAFGPGMVGYTVQMCDSRLLVEQDFPAPEPGHDIVAPPRVATGNFITFNGYDYAVADNTSPSSTSAACPTLLAVFLDSNSEWEIAPNEDASAIAVSGSATTFGTQCLNTLGGTALTYNGASCPDEQNHYITLPYSTGNIYYTPNCSRILLRRASTLPNSWVTSVDVITNYLPNPNVAVTVNVVTGTYATMNNTSPIDKNAPPCQNGYMTLPSGWRLSTQQELTDWVVYNPWAFSTVYCFATVGFSYNQQNATCATVLTKTVNSVNYYYPNTCAQILLVKV